MPEPLLVHDGALHRATVVDRPNRFVLRVHVDDGEEDADPERAHLADPGALSILDPGTTVLCSPADDPGRATDWDAIAARSGDVWVSLRAALANDLFAAALARGAIPAFRGHDVLEREPRLPEHGRTDFRLRTPDGDSALVEVKSATHVEDGVCKFPDRQTERGRRHLRSLEGLAGDGVETHLVFVVQRPDARAVQPFRAVDPGFADRLFAAREAGVGVHALSVAFDPPDYHLHAADLPVEVDPGGTAAGGEE